MFGCDKKKQCDAEQQSQNSLVHVYYTSCFCNWCISHANAAYVPLAMAKQQNEIKQLREDNERLKNIKFSDMLKEAVVPRIAELEKQLKKNEEFYQAAIKENKQLKELKDWLQEICEVRAKEWFKIKEENEKLKAENNKLKDIICEMSVQNLVAATHDYDMNCECDKCAIQKLKAENEDLLAWRKFTCAEIVNLQTFSSNLVNENEQLKKSVDSYIACHVKNTFEKTQPKGNA